MVTETMVNLIILFLSGLLSYFIVKNEKDAWASWIFLTFVSSVVGVVLFYSIVYGGH